jgi:hypothetical protein
MGSRSRLDVYRTAGDTGHVSLLVENHCVRSLQGGTFLRYVATGHTSLRIAWDINSRNIAKVLTRNAEQEDPPGKRKFSS